MTLLEWIGLGGIILLPFWAFSGVVTCFLAGETGDLTEVFLVLMTVLSVAIVIPIAAMIMPMTTAIAIVPFVPSGTTSVPTIMVMAMVVTIPMPVEVVSTTVLMIVWLLLNGSRVILTVATTVLPLPSFLLLYIVIQSYGLIQ